MNVLKHHRLSRRLFLRGLGAALPLPFLEAMLPQRVAGAGGNKVPTRCAFFYYGTGMNMRQFEPTDEGRDFKFSRVLKPLEKHRGDLTVFSGTYLAHGGGHQGDYTFLTGTEGRTPSGIKGGISADQFIANRVGKSTRYPSLQLSTSKGTGFGGTLATLSWNANGIPLAAENDPGDIFDRLFKTDNPREATARARGFERRGSVLDAVTEQARRLQSQISGADKAKLDEYFNSVREVEKQLNRDIDWSKRPKPVPETRGMSEFKSYVPNQAPNYEYETFAKMMYDLIALAFQTDSTRVITYVVRPEGSGGDWKQFGVSKDFHSLSHHNNDPKNLEELARVDTVYMEHWAYFMNRMKSIKEADGRPLLDHTMLGFSSGMGIGHSRDRLPTVLCGGSAAGVRHQGHLRLPENTPLAGVWQTVAERMGVNTGGEFQDSHGIIKPIVA